MNQALDAFQLVGNPVASSDVPVQQVDVFLIAAQMGVRTNSAAACTRRIFPCQALMEGYRSPAAAGLNLNKEGKYETAANEPAWRARAQPGAR
jgi:hypothetical protein